VILEKGNMWDAFGKGVFMITTNPIRRKDGAVVMGRGIALEAKTRFPSLPYDFGKQLETYPHLSTTIGFIGRYDGVPIYHFMVKDHWKNSASLDIIKGSVEAMNYWGYIADFYEDRIDLNFPGIGNGKLKREDVLPLLEDLPDNVHIWEKE
jgi:hypothetical protein